MLIYPITIFSSVDFKEILVYPPSLTYGGKRLLAFLALMLLPPPPTATDRLP